MQFYSIYIISFIILVINCFMVNGEETITKEENEAKELTVSKEENEAIELMIKDYFQDESDECKDEYRNLQKLILNDDNCKSVQSYLYELQLTQCQQHTVGYQVISMELYDLFRDCSEDRNGIKCVENEVQDEFDKFGVCLNVCSVKMANYLYILRNYFSARMQGNQEQLIDDCSKVKQPPPRVEKRQQQEEEESSAISKYLIRGSYLPILLYIIFNYIM